MKYNNTITTFLLNGQHDKSINNWKRTLQRVIKSEPSTWTFNQFNSLYGTMDFVLNFDPFVKGVVNKRLFLIKAYDYQICDSFEQFVSEQLETFYKILYNVIFFGKCLVKIEHSMLRYFITIIPPQKYYVNEGDIIFLTDEEYNLDSLLYFGSDLFDISALALSIVPYSITKEHNYSLWYNNNIYLNGFIHSSISPELAVQVPQDETIQKVADKVIEQVSDLSETSGVLYTPAGVDIQHKDVVNTNVGSSYLQYINQIRVEIENIILGRSTQQKDTSYASEKIRFTSTTDIQFSDVKTIEHIINSVLKYIKWQQGGGELESKFEINVAVDEDELSMIQVLNGVKNLGAVDEYGEPLSVDSKWLSETLRIPFENTGSIKLLTSGQESSVQSQQLKKSAEKTNNSGKKERVCSRCSDAFEPSRAFQRECDKCRKKE